MIGCTLEAADFSFIQEFFVAKYFMEVVGIYYRRIIDMDAGASIKEILDEVNGVDGFSYQPSFKPDGTLNKVAVMSNDLPEPGFSPTRGNNSRPPGRYSIAEQAIGPLILAWQYYIERPVGGMDLPAYKAALEAGDTSAVQRLRKNVAFQRVSYTRAGDGFKNIDESEKCEDGDVIVWRCVGVLLNALDSDDAPADAAEPQVG